MAKTRQTAKKSTGGRAPRADIAWKAARKTARQRKSKKSFTNQRIFQTLWYDPRSNIYNIMWKDAEPLSPVEHHSEEELAKMLSRAAIDWAKERPLRRLTQEDCWHYGLTESGDDGSIDGTDWALRRIILATKDLSTEYGWCEGQLYGSDKDQGPLSDFHLVLLYTLNSEEELISKTSSNGETVIANVPSPTSVISTNGFVELQQSPYMKAQNKDYVLEWCRDHPNQVMQLAKPGARRPSCHSWKYHVKGMPVYCVSKKSACLRASIANCIWLLETLDNETKALNMLNLGPLPAGIRNFGHASQWLNREDGLGIYNVSRVDIPRNIRKIEWVLNTKDHNGKEKEGIYLVRIHGTKGVDHCVAIDYSTKLIYDCFELWAMTLSKNSLQCCVGDGSYIRCVAEVRSFCKSVQ